MHECGTKVLRVQKTLDMEKLESESHRVPVLLRERDGRERTMRKLPVVVAKKI